LVGYKATNISPRCGSLDFYRIDCQRALFSNFLKKIKVLQKKREVKKNYFSTKFVF